MASSVHIYQRPLGQILTSGEIAGEVARTLIGSIGLVLAIPITTAIGAAVVATSRRPTDARQSSVSPSTPDPQRAQ